MLKSQTRKSGLERRREVAQAVLRIIGEKGITSLTTTALAKEVGFTSGALFRHFTSLDEILLEATRFAIAKIEETFPDPNLPPVERIITLARNRVNTLGSNVGLAWFLRSDQAFLTLPDKAVDLLRQLVQRSKKYIISAIEEGADAGVIRQDIEPDILIVLVTGTVQALIGMPGIHKVTDGDQLQKSEQVLRALEKLLAPPSKEL